MSNSRSQALAERLEQGAKALEDLARTLSDSEWQTRLPHDGRKVGVVVHHVATMYPLEMQLTRVIAEGKPIEGVTTEAVAEINAKHANEFDGVTKEAAIELLRRNSAAAAAEIRTLTDEQLTRAALVSYYGDAPVSCQFWVEDHPVRHSFHHLAKIRRALGARSMA